MGRGSGTTQKDVQKPRVRHDAGDGSGVPSFGGETSSSETSVNACLFSLELKINYAAGGPRVMRGDTVTLVRMSASEIGIFVDNKRLSSYTGKQKALLLKCMTKGFVYSGQVQSVGANTLRAIVKGGVLSHETPSAA